MTDQELDTLMQRVLLDSLKLDWDERKKPQPPFVASLRYQREVRYMLADPLAWAQKWEKPIWKRAVQRVAVILLVIFLGFSGLMTSSPTVRAAVLQWVTEWYETHIIYRYAGATITETMPQYEITELPEGYAEVESKRIEEPNYIDIVYRNDITGKTIHLEYVYMQQGSASSFITSNFEICPVTVNGMDGQLFLPEDWEKERSAITWFDLNRDLQFTVHAHLDKTDILRIAESVSLLE